MSNTSFFKRTAFKQSTVRVALLAFGVLALVQGVPQAGMAWAAGTSLSTAQQLFNKGMVGQSINHFERYTRANPTHAAGFTWLGRAYKKQGGPANTLKAQQAFEKALSLNAGEQLAQRELAEIYSWNSATRPKAIELYKRYTAANSSDVQAKKQLAQLYIWSGQYSLARPYINAVGASNDISYLSALAQYHTYEGDAREAVRLYEGPLASGDASRVLGNRQNYVAALVKAGNYTKAKQVYDSLLASAGSTGGDSLPTSALNAISGMAFELGDFNQVISMDQKLLERTQGVDHGMVGLRLARAYGKTRQYAQSAALLTELNNQGLLSPNEKLEVADLLQDATLAGVRLPDPSLVETLLRQASQTSTDKAGTAARLARYYAKQPGHFTDALNNYIYAAERDPSGKVKRELVGFLQMAQKQPSTPWREGFAKALQSFPNDLTLLSGYAETLSWNAATRGEALQQYLALGRAYPNMTQTFTPKVDKALMWEKATKAKIGLYNELGRVYPLAQGPKLAVARAYWQDPAATKADIERAAQTYEELATVMGGDPQFMMEYGQMLSNSRSGALKRKGTAMMQTLADQHPEDADVQLSYARSLSYSSKYSESVRAFDRLLAANPNSKEARLGKGYALLWGGNYFKSKDVFEDLRADHPNDLEVIKALAESYKHLGRNDKVLELYEHAKQLDTHPARSATPSHGLSFANTVVEETPLTVASTAPTAEATYDFAELNNAMNTLHTQQQQGEQAVQRLETTVGVLEELAPSNAVVQGVGVLAPPAPNSVAQFALPSFDKATQAQQALNMGGTSLGSYALRVSADEDPVVGNQVGARGDLMYLDQLASLTNDTAYDMRPSLRSGFLWTTQDGDEGLNKFDHWVVPNQLSFMLTPTIRLRGGYGYRGMSLPTTRVWPRSEHANQYSLGTTWLLHERVLFDGDISLTQYENSDSNAVDYQARLQFKPMDKFKWQVGMRRSPLENSFLSFAGFRPGANVANVRALLGQVRENAVFTEFNFGPWQNWDLNLGYEYGWINSNPVEYRASNNKNQAWANLGYNWQYHPNHAVRLAYEFLYFGYDKDATFNYFNVRNGQNPLNVQTLFPNIVAAPNGSIFGGYFSPSSFFLNDIRADFRGSCLNKFLEYKIGGSVGIQSVTHDEIGRSSDTGAAWSANAQLTANLTDWLSLYGQFEYLDSAGIFSRTRLGGGVIVRPDIPALQPLIGKRSYDE
ncbi:MAG: hypothetical protein ACKO34_07130 [Vampirovibrionales bacterium]